MSRCVRVNWGLPFIASFLLLLFASAVLLAVGGVSVAEITADFAYFALAIGVVLKLGNVNSKTAREGIVLIKKLKVKSQHVHFGINRLKKGAVFHGSD